MSHGFKFEIGDEVKIAISTEHGRVVARSQYEVAESTYRIRYKLNNGVATERWWTESALEEV